MRLWIPLLLALAAGGPSPLEAQLIDRITQRAKDKVTERKAQTEENLVERATEPVDSALERAVSPLDSLVASGAGAVAGIVAKLGKPGADDEAETAQLSEQLAAGQAELAEVQFAFGSTEPLESSARQLRALATALRQSPASYLLEGRALEDEAEDAAGLGKMRAMVIREWLAQEGIDPESLRVMGREQRDDSAPLAVTLLE